MNSKDLHFSEEQFDGFHELSIQIDSEGLQLSCVVPDYLQEAFEKDEAVKVYMETVTSSTTPKEFSLWGKGTIRWEEVEYLLYFEQDSKDYQFVIELVDDKKNRAQIKGFGPEKGSHSILNTGDKDDFSEIIDARQDQGNKSFLEQDYLKKCYQKIIAAVEPFVIEALLEKSVAQLKNGTKIEFGPLEIDLNGLYLKQKGWIFSKKVLVNWTQVKIGQNLKAYHFSDLSNPKIKTVVPRVKLENKGLLLKLILWGKNQGT